MTDYVFTQRKPESFDWVAARAACSLLVIFEKLKLQIKSDIESRNATRPPNMQYAFSFVDGKTTRFSVVVEGNQVRDSLEFSLEEYIYVRGKNGVILKADVALCDDGECRVKIDGQAFDLWQVRKKALEEFFFGHRE